MKKNNITLICCCMLSAFTKAQTPHVDTVLNNSANRDINFYEGKNIVTTVHQNKNTGAWVNDMKQTDKQYNARQQVISGTIQRWNGTGWVNYVNETTSYDDSGKATGWVNQNWVNQAWVNSLRVFVSDTLTLHQDWENNAWTNQTRRLDNDTLTLDQVWINSHWVNKTRTLSAYVPSFKRKMYLVQYWVDGKWGDNAPLDVRRKTPEKEVNLPPDTKEK